MSESESAYRLSLALKPVASRGETITVNVIKSTKCAEVRRIVAESVGVDASCVQIVADSCRDERLSCRCACVHVPAFYYVYVRM